MIPPVPFAVRVVLALSLKVLAFLVEVVAILLDAFADWIGPELARKTSNQSEISSREPRP